MSRSIQAALLDAGFSPDMIGFYDAHGTGTLANDGAETSALDIVFPSPVSVTAKAGWGIHKVLFRGDCFDLCHEPQSSSDYGNFSSPRNIYPIGLCKSPKRAAPL